MFVCVLVYENIQKSIFLTHSREKIPNIPFGTLLLSDLKYLILFISNTSIAYYFKYSTCYCIFYFKN